MDTAMRVYFGIDYEGRYDIFNRPINLNLPSYAEIPEEKYNEWRNILNSYEKMQKEIELLACKGKMIEFKYGDKV